MGRILGTLLATAASAALFAGSASAQTGQAEAEAKKREIVVIGKERIPVAEFIKKANMRNPRISPDGTKLAYLAASNGREVLVLQDLTDTSKPPKQILEAEEARESGDRSMAGFRWIGNKHVVMTLQSREDLGGGPADFLRLVAYSLDSGKLVEQAWTGAGGNASTILYIDHDKGEFLLQRDTVNTSNELRGRPEVLRVNVATGNFTTEQRINPIVSTWVADSTGVIRAGLSRDSDNGKVRMIYRSNGKEAFRTVFNEADKTFTEALPNPDMIIPGTDIGIIESRSDGFSKIYRMDMTKMAIVGKMFETPGFDVQGTVVDQNGKGLLGYRTFDGEMGVKYVDPTLKQAHAFLEEMFGKNEATIVDFDTAKQKLIVFGGGKSKGGAFYLYDLAAAKVQLINWQRASLQDSPLNEVKAEWYTASDGVRMQAIVTYPRHRSPKNLPVVVMPHGGPFGAISATNQTEPWHQPLAEAGYLVIQPNYRGSGGYGKAFEKLGRDPGGYGKRMQDDLTDVLNHYAQLGIVDPKRACIMGWSYGGYAAARGAQRDPNVWKCAIAGAGVYDMPKMNDWDAENLGRFSRGFQATSDDPVGISSARHTDGQWAPILIVAGVRDARIPLEQSRTLVSRLKGSGKKEGIDFKYIEQPQGTHNLPYDDVHSQWIEESEAWLKRFNPAYVPSDPDYTKQPPLSPRFQRATGSTTTK